MREVLCCLLCVLTVGCSTTACRSDSWFGRDKLYHFACSAAIGAAGTAVARHNDAPDVDSGAVGVGTALAIGSSKEAYDLAVKDTCWSWKDMVWNVVGAFVGASLAAACD